MTGSSVLLGALILLTTVAYLPGLSGPFFFDTTPHLSENPALRLPLSRFDHWYTAVLSSDAGPLKRPLAMLSFAVQAKISGLESAAPYKLFNIFIHLFNGVLVYLITRALCRTVPNLADRMNTNQVTAASLLCAGLFLLHPIQLTSVLYVVQRMASLSALFVFAGILVYLRARAEWLDRVPDNREIARLLSKLMLVTTAGVLCKESALLLPWLVVVCELTLYSCVIGGQKNLRLQRLCYASFVLPLLVGMLYLILSPQFLADWYTGREYDWQERLLTQSRVLWQYLYWLFNPASSGIGFHHDQMLISAGIMSPWTTAPAMLGWLAAILFTFFGPSPYWAQLVRFAIGWYLVAHGLESTIVPLEMVYEHRNYVPLFGIVFCLAVAMSVAGRKMPVSAVLCRGLVTVVFLCFAVLLFVRASYWGDKLELAAVLYANNQSSPRATYEFGNALFTEADAAAGYDLETRQDMLINARTLYERWLELDPDSVTAITTLIYMERRYFGETVPTRWQQLDHALNKPVFGASDYNALGLLVDCSVHGYCIDTGSRFNEVMEGLLGRQAAKALIWYQWARYTATAQQDFAQAAQLAHRATDEDPTYFPAYWYAIALEQKLNNQAAVLRLVQRIMENDPLRSQIAFIRRLRI